MSARPALFKEHSTDTLVFSTAVPYGIAAVKVRISTNSFHSFWTGISGSAAPTRSQHWLTATLSPSTTAWWLTQTPWVTNVTFYAESYASTTSETLKSFIRP